MTLLVHYDAMINDQLPVEYLTEFFKSKWQLLVDCFLKYTLHNVCNHNLFEKFALTFYVSDVEQAVLKFHFVHMIDFRRNLTHCIVYI